MTGSASQTSKGSQFEFAFQKVRLSAFHFTLSDYADPSLRERLQGK